MGVTIRRTGKPYKFDAVKVEKLIKAYVPGAIIRRTDKGISSTGSIFAPYSPEYVDALRRGGESTAVDLRLTGGLINSIKVVSIDVSANSLRFVIAPDAGTSPSVTLADGRAKRKSGRSPPHNVLGYWIENGTASMPARPFLGLTPAQEKELAILLDKAKLFG
jgi:hypothetical protein